jgi:hypothetical protein
MFCFSLTLNVLSSSIKLNTSCIKWPKVDAKALNPCNKIAYECNTCMYAILKFGGKGGICNNPIQA